MHHLLRIVAVIAGLAAGGSTVAGIEWVSSRMHPMPAGLNMEDRAAMAEWVATLPTSAFLMLLLAWGTGCLIGAFVARFVAAQRSVLPAFIVVGLLLLGTVSNLVMLPHPWWLWPTGILACIVGGVIGMLLAAPNEYVVQTTRNIKASQENVFRTIADIRNFSQAIPNITNIEFLTDQNYGVGTRFRETREMNGKPATVELEVTELNENEHVRIVSDAGGTIWDTTFTVQKNDDEESVTMNMQMDARPHNVPAKFFTPLIMNMVAGAVESDMDAVKTYCEAE